MPSRNPLAAARDVKVLQSFDLEGASNKRVHAVETTMVATGERWDRTMR